MTVSDLDFALIVAVWIWTVVTMPLAAALLIKKLDEVERDE